MILMNISNINLLERTQNNFLRIADSYLNYDLNWQLGIN